MADETEIARWSWRILSDRREFIILAKRKSVTETSCSHEKVQRQLHYWPVAQHHVWNRDVQLEDFTKIREIKFPGRSIVVVVVVIDIKLCFYVIYVIHVDSKTIKVLTPKGSIFFMRGCVLVNLFPLLSNYVTQQSAIHDTCQRARDHLEIERSSGRLIGQVLQNTFWTAANSRLQSDLSNCSLRINLIAP